MTEVPEQDASKTFAAVWVPILLGILGSVSGGIGWAYSIHDAHEAKVEQAAADLKRLNDSRVSDYLKKIELYLSDNEQLFKQLSTYNEPGWGIMQSYVRRAERDPNDAQLKTINIQIGRLVQGNSKIVGLLDSYWPYICTGEFKKQARLFREQTSIYGDRWASVPAIIQSKSQLDNWKSFPDEFLHALQLEIQALRLQRTCTAD